MKRMPIVAMVLGAVLVFASACSSSASGTVASGATSSGPSHSPVPITAPTVSQAAKSCAPPSVKVVSAPNPPQTADGFHVSVKVCVPAAYELYIITRITVGSTPAGVTQNHVPTNKGSLYTVTFRVPTAQLPNGTHLDPTYVVGDQKCGAAIQTIPDGGGASAPSLPPEPDCITAQGPSLKVVVVAKVA